MSALLDPLAMGAGGASPQDFRTQTNRLLVERSRVGLGMALFSIFVFALADPFVDPGNLHFLIPLKVLQVGIVALIFWMLRSPEATEHAAAIAFLGIAALCVTTAASGILTDETVAPPLLLIVLTMMIGTLLPWGVLPQVGIVVVSAASVVWNFLMVEGRIPAYPAVAVIAAFAVSIALAHQFDSYRRELAQRGSHLAKIRNDFVAMLAHDIRSPLSAIVGYADLLEDEVPKEGDPADFVKRIRLNALRAEGLASNFLEMSKLEAGELQLYTERQALNPVVENVLLAQEALADAHGVKLEAQLEPSLPEADIDRRQMERVVANLIGNALKFSPRGSKVVVRTVAGAGTVGVEVKDQGPGVPADKRGRLFQRYDRAGTKTVEGTGLGLFIVRNVVEAHGGTVGAEFPSEGGSLFRVSIPVPANGTAE